ncbi:hypothetical protein FRC11_003535, partial [Ceratobasidium sp. 423]
TDTHTNEHDTETRDLNCEDQEEENIEPLHTTHEHLAPADQESIVLVFDRGGQLRPRSQIDDYTYRAEEASHYNVLDYFVNTYETQRSKKEAASTASVDRADDIAENHTQGTLQQPSPGRPAHRRIQYLPGHPRHENWVRVLRPAEHNTLPNMIGPYFPRRSDPDQAHLRAAWCLTLLKPWRKLTDLKTPQQSWTDALDDFIASSDNRIADIIDNLDYYRTCEAAAEAKQSESNIIEEADIEDEDFEVPESLDSNRGQGISSLEVTQEMIDEAIKRNENHRDAAHGYQAVDIGYSKGLFDSVETPTVSIVSRATANDLEALERWLCLLEKEKQLVTQVRRDQAPTVINIYHPI